MAVSRRTPSCGTPGRARRSRRSAWRAAAAIATPARSTSSSCWDRQAELAAEHLVKGQQVAFCGRLDPRPWTGRDGAERVSLEVHGVELEYGAKPRSSGQAAAAEPAVD